MRERTVAVRMGKGPQIMLASGRWFDLLDPQNSEFTIEDIAHGLGNICRYAGQCRRFYSVAEHSLYVSCTVESYELEALLHDAAEAFLGDITRPLKQLLPDYKRIEKNVEAAIYERFGLDPESKEIVKAADLRVLAAEQSQVMPPGTDDWAVLTRVIPAPIKISYLSPDESRQAFLRRFMDLRAHAPTSTAQYAPAFVCRPGHQHR
ncbi:hypothetical protein [Microvirga sp. KLBC 81]|uniref:hypothetical protein n=1 Tax=Microvirga sp. KLBC 81 TaxID=1862707 RepID=UPI001FDFF38C|nr:hypothetical protein [Microvirga sp. KLBC 81]